MTEPKKKFKPPVVPPPSITIRPRPAPQPVPPPVRAKPPVTAKPPAVPNATVRVTFRCGCKSTVSKCLLFDCNRHSRHKRHLKLMASKQKKLDAKTAELGDIPATDFGGTELGRLPANTTKTLTYDGTSWLGRMTVPGCSEVFIATAATERACFHELHDRYLVWHRARLKSQTAPTENPPA